MHADPALPEIEVWAYRYDDLAEQTDRLERAVRRRTGSLVRRFDAIVDLLADLGYLTDDPDRPEPTADGLRLAGLYAETDLVLAETYRRGVLDDLDAPALAAVASAFVYESRQKDPPPVRPPTAEVADALDTIEDIAVTLTAREVDAGLPATRPLDAGFAEAAWRWAGGADLDEVLGETERTAGDFVRTTKQVADLLRQLADAAGGDPARRALATAAPTAARALVRGVVAHTGL